MPAPETQSEETIAEEETVSIKEMMRESADEFREVVDRGDWEKLTEFRNKTAISREDRQNLEELLEPRAERPSGPSE